MPGIPSARHTSTVQAFRDHLKKIKHFQESISVLSWDLRTGAPVKGRARRAEAIGTLSDELFALETSDELRVHLETLGEQADLDPVTAAAVRLARQNYDRKKKVPAALNKEFVIQRAKAQSVWEEAKKQSDFSLFLPDLEKNISLVRELTDHYGYEGHRYNATLFDYDPDVTAEGLDQVFGELRPFLVNLTRRIQEKGTPYQAMTPRPYDKARLEAFSRFALDQMGYDFTAGRLDETVHPFETALNLGDVRVTTKYVADDFRPTVFGTIHEGGHAQYEQGIDPALENTPLCRGTSSGLHESQSRFWENVIGRSRAYWERYYGDFQRFFPEQTAGVSLDEFYLTCNLVQPSLIRIEADEVTYNLHIMVRYELEKELLDGRLAPADLPAAWASKMQDYLGVVPPNDAEGVLQDVHWSSGLFGCFPSYALGNLYAAQFRHALRRDLPDLDDRVRSGDLFSIKAWLNRNIHQHGKTRTATELVEQVSGAPVSPQYFMDYLEQKFTALYNL
jgi:carboxypeptidase Taq